jgi:hypothetical protein
VLLTLDVLCRCFRYSRKLSTCLLAWGFCVFSFACVLGTSENNVSQIEIPSRIGSLSLILTLILTLNLSPSSSFSLFITAARLSARGWPKSETGSTPFHPDCGKPCAAAHSLCLLVCALRVLGLCVSGGETRPRL